MSNFRETLRNLIGSLSEKNYDGTLAQYRFWLDLGTAHGHISKGQVEDDAEQLIRPDCMKDDGSELIHPTAHLFFRFIGDMEDKLTSRRASEYHKQRCARTVSGCLELNLALVKSGNGWGATKTFLTNINLIARWANLGSVEEAVIHNHILQSLISHPKLHDHQAYALIIFFKLAGATFETYTEPSVLDRCFQLLEGHYAGYGYSYSHNPVKRELTQVRTPRTIKGGHHAEANS